MLRQQSLLAPFGIDKAEYYDLIWVLIGSSTLLLGLYSWWVLRRPRGRGDALDLAYSALCGKLAKIGVPRAANEGPVNFSARLNELAADPGLQIIFDRYVGLRYAHALPESDAVREFTASVRALRVPEALAKIYREGVKRTR
jgi:hypothetical protein